MWWNTVGEMKTRLKTAVLGYVKQVAVDSKLPSRTAVTIVIQQTQPRLIGRTTYMSQGG